MGDFRLIGEHPGAKRPGLEIRMAGHFEHQGPFSTLNFPNGGRGRVSWIGLLGRGSVTLHGREFAAELKYLASGHYTYEVHDGERLVCVGRIREDRAPIPPDNDPLPALE